MKPTFFTIDQCFNQHAVKIITTLTKSFSDERRKFLSTHPYSINIQVVNRPLDSSSHPTMSGEKSLFSQGFEHEPPAYDSGTLTTKLLPQL